ncbi:hypothetical protein HQ524_04805 [Candidatus Uhrbacteria bacterium]|nr:hypothetical protein [Candidatus Uhrbacteria bacterium]
MDRRSVAKTLTYTSFFSWLLFVGVELAVTTSVTRVFSPHIFLLLFFVGLFWWYQSLIKKKG